MPRQRVSDNGDAMATSMSNARPQQSLIVDDEDDTCSEIQRIKQKVRDETEGGAVGRIVWTIQVREQMNTLCLFF